MSNPNLPPLQVDFSSPLHEHPDFVPSIPLLASTESPAEKVTPSDIELRLALLNLKGKNPTLGITKTHQLLCDTYTGWRVSEKRTRKIMKDAGLILGNEGATTEQSALLKDIQAPSSQPDVSQPLPKVYPTSKLMPSLDTSRWSPKVAVKFFDKRKGKGLIALEDIKEGEILWTEDPWILAPEWDIYDLQKDGRACGFCETLFDSSSPLVLNCPSTNSISSSGPTCPFKFCNRLCVSRSHKTHPLLCPSQNPASIPLLKYAHSSQWMALHAFSQSASRLLLSAQLSPESIREDYTTYQAFAVLGLEERFKWSFRAAPDAEPDRETWKKAYGLFREAFREPKGDGEKKKLKKILKKDIKDEEDWAQEIFGYEGFLRGLGRMSLNLEAHGGLYVLHSHLNHSCSPNLSCRHLDKATHLSRISLVTTKLIKAGEELTISYVNPESNVEQRREELRQWGWGECTCVRCVTEWRKLREERKKRKDKGIDMDDLAAEVKAGLGVF